MDIFVGNLSFDATQRDIKSLFGEFGNVASVFIVMRDQKKAPKSRGFGFVQMPDEKQALAAIAALAGKEFMGRILDVNVARRTAEGIMESVLKHNKPGAYKSGRRTQSYVKRMGLAGLRQPAKPRRIQDNPLRWRKKKDQSRPKQKSPDEK